MRAVTFMAPGQVLVQDVPEPVLSHPRDAIVRIEARGVCGSDLHIFHGRVKIEPGFTIGHEYVGTVVEAGADVRELAAGDRVLGCFQTACGRCFFCRRGLFHKCDESRTFGHGATLGSLPGPQAELALRLTRKSGVVQAIGVYAERCEVHMGLLWIKALSLRSGHANVIGHIDAVLAMMSAGVLDPSALVTHHMKLDQAPEAYALYDRREALKIVLNP